MNTIPEIVKELEALGFQEHRGRKSYLKMVYLRDFNDSNLYFLKDEHGEYVLEYRPDRGFFYKKNRMLSFELSEVQDLPSLLILYGRGHFLNEKY